MLVIISPSKTMGERAFPDYAHGTSPQFLERAETLVNKLNEQKDSLGKLLGVNDDLVELNLERFRNWSIETHETGHPAAFAYIGDVYNGLAAQELTEHQLEFGQKHLRIISGLYGALRPMDKILPYRLEMNTKLKGAWGKDLYAFWGDSIAEAVQSQYPSFVLNCASNEYFKAIEPYLSKHLPIITPKFLHDSADGPKQKMTFSKYSRGLLARWAVANEIRDPEAVQKFDYEGYKYSAEHSKPGAPVFIAPKSFTLMGRFKKS